MQPLSVPALDALYSPTPRCGIPYAVPIGALGGLIGWAVQISGCPSSGSLGYPSRQAIPLNLVVSHGKPCRLLGHSRPGAHPGPLMALDRRDYRAISGAVVAASLAQRGYGCR